MKTVIRSMGMRAMLFPLTAACTLASAAITIDYGGETAYGAIALIGSLILLVPFADLGLGAAVINGVAAPDPEKSSADVVRTAAKMLLTPAAGLLMIAAAAGIFGWWPSLLGVGEQGLDNINEGASLSLGIFALTLPMSVGARAVIGLGRNPIAVALQSASSVVLLLAVLVMVALRVDPLLLSIGPAVGGLVVSLASMGVVTRWLGPSVWPWRYWRSTPWDKEMFATGLPMMLILTMLPIVFQGQRLVVAHRGSPSELSELSLMLQVYNPLWSFVAVGAVAMWPLFAASRNDSRAHVTRVLLRTLLGFGTIALVFALAFGVAGPTVAGIIADGAIEAEYALFWWGGALLAAQALQQVPGMFLTDRRGLWFQAGLVGAMAATSLTAAWLLAPRFGPVAVVGATALGVALVQFLPGIARVGVVVRRMRSSTGEHGIS